MAEYDAIGRTLTVTEANAIIRDTVAEFFSELTIEGEVSGFRPSSSGHWYFTLKDSQAALDAAVFRSAQYSMAAPKNGDLVIAKGSLSYYAKNGRLSFVIRSMRIKGEGSLLEMIEKRKDYYRSLGYFDEDRKRPIPEEIRRIGVVTSPTGAAIRDVLNITKRRAPGIDIIIFPCLVQGEEAAEDIAARIRQANAFAAADVLIVGRGGGSAEDLAPFSDSAVIEAIHESEIPVISAVGHEIDWPISDFAADRRAPTPSAAAELVTEGAYRRAERLRTILSSLSSEMRTRVWRMDSRLRRAESFKGLIAGRISRARALIPSTSELGHALNMRLSLRISELGWTEEEAARAMRDKVERGRDEVGEMGKEAEAILSGRMKDARSRLAMAERECQALSPLSILSRGYSVTMDGNGRVIRHISGMQAGDIIRTRISDGELIARVEDSHEL